eukprot:TRINITY_DN1228_c0_g1_i1.p1 TRINITY_DN1228_c0_g1~~TRINITY_DN1228_c0_g1_i1.p1  ORF type:complete len:676 (+),score=259.75 TRINITY_DN1228_c0_g1_i1:109-2028(+)
MNKADDFLEQQKQDATTIQEKKILSDAQGLIEATNQLMINKNPDEKLQRFIEASAKVTQDAASTATSEIGEMKVTTTEKKQVQDIYDGLLGFLKMLSTSPEFRHHILDLTNIMQDIFVRTEIIKPNSNLLSSSDVVTTLPTSTGSVGYPYTETPFKPATLDTSSAGFGLGATSSVVDLGSPVGLGARSVDDWSTNYTWGVTNEERNDWKAQIPAHLRHEFADRLIKVFSALRTRPDWTRGVLAVFSILDTQAARLQQIANATSSSVEESSHAQVALEEGKALLESFSKRSLEPLLASTKDLINFILNDPEMWSWVKELRYFFENSFEFPNLWSSEQYSKRLERLIDDGRRLMNNVKYRTQYQLLLSESQALFESIVNDADVVNLQEKAKSFLQNFAIRDKTTGEITFDTDLLMKLRKYLVPFFVELMDKIPIPVIEGSTDEYEFKLENIVFSGYDIIPEHIEIHSRSDMDLNVKDLNAEKINSLTTIKISHIMTKIENMKFWFKRKTFPAIEDSGLADVELRGNEGAKLLVDMQMLIRDNNPVFRVMSSHVEIDRLRITVTEAKHEWLLNVFAAVFETKLKETMSRSIEEKMNTLIKSLEEGFTNVVNQFPAASLKQFAKEQLLGNNTNTTSATKPIQG